MYDIVTIIALVGGTVGWLLFTRGINTHLWKRLAALLVIGVTTVFFTRLFHILFWGLEQTINHPNLLFRLDSGRSIHGSIFGFGVSVLLVSRLWNSSLATVATPISFWPLFGLVCARIGNFWNNEMIGTPSSWPMAVGFYFSGDRGATPRHPVVLYEAALATLLMIVMVLLWRINKTRHYAIPAIAITGYSIIRFSCDFIKERPGFPFDGPLSTGQWLSMVYFVVGIWLLTLKKENVK